MEIHTERADRATLKAGGQLLYDALTSRYQLTGVEHVLLIEACRAKDRLDRLAQHPEAVTETNLTARSMAQLIAALRLPDPTTGKRPRRRPPRGVYVPGGRR